MTRVFSIVFFCFFFFITTSSQRHSGRRWKRVNATIYLIFDDQRCFIAIHGVLCYSFVYEVERDETMWRGETWCFAKTVWKNAYFITHNEFFIQKLLTKYVVGIVWCKCVIREMEWVKLKFKWQSYFLKLNKKHE